MTQYRYYQIKTTNIFRKTSKINRKYSQNSKPTYRDGTGNYLYRGRQPFLLENHLSTQFAKSKYSSN